MIVKGQVKDSAGTLIPNVHVIAGSKGSITNFMGEYSIEVNPSDPIKFTHLGMKTQLYKANQVPGIVRMSDDGYNLSEVVLQSKKTPFYKTTGFKIGLAVLFLGGLLFKNPKKYTTGLNGFTRVAI